MENKLATYIVDYQKCDNPILADDMIEILTEAFHNDPYNFGIPEQLKENREFATQVVVPSYHADRHLFAFDRYMFKKTALICNGFHETTDNYKDDSEIEHLMGELCKPFSFEQDESEIIYSGEKGLELIRLKLKALEDGRLDMTVSEAIQFAFCFPKHGKKETKNLCTELFKNIKENINDNAIEAFFDVLFNLWEFYCDLDLTSEFRYSI